MLSSTGFLLWAVGPKSFCIVGPFFGLLLMYVGLDPVGPGSFNKSLDEKKKELVTRKAYFLVDHHVVSVLPANVAI